MWPSQNKIRNIKTDQFFEDEISKLFNRFGTIILNDWINETFNEKTISIAGVDLILKIAKCENCKSYIGLNPITKKIKRISVLSGFCKFFDSGIKRPEDKICRNFDPKQIYKEIILDRLEETYGIKN